MQFVCQLIDVTILLALETVLQPSHAARTFSSSSSDSVWFSIQVNTHCAPPANACPTALIGNVVELHIFPNHSCGNCHYYRLNRNRRRNRCHYHLYHYGHHPHHDHGSFCVFQDVEHIASEICKAIAHDKQLLRIGKTLDS